MGAGWVQTLKTKNKKKKLAEEHTCTCTDGKKLDGILVGYHAFIHHFISSYAFLLSCGKDGTYSSKFAWSPLFFYTVWVYRDSRNAFRGTFGLVLNSKYSFDKLAFTWKRLQSNCRVSYLCPLFSQPCVFSTGLSLFPRGRWKKITLGLLGHS